MTRKILSGEAKWIELYSRCPFPDKYRHFLTVKAAARNQEDQLAWVGLVENRMRLFLSAVERDRSIDLVHICLKQYAWKTWSVRVIGEV